MREYVEPRKLRAGKSYAVYLDDEDFSLASWEMRLDGKGTVALARVENGWKVNWEGVTRTARTQVIQGELSSSLEEAIRRQGGPSSLAYRMAEVLRWDLDFARDLRKGDHFQVAFQEVFLDGKSSGAGEILALRYYNRGRLFESYRYGDDGSYYDSEGRPMKKMFLRSPMRFSRVTSRFSHRRFHPVLKTYRPHYGVDYGGPVGSPVMVTASGTVTFAGWNRGGGKMVRVRHPQGYITHYLHLSGFAKGMTPGRFVRQGEVVGYLGATGLASGPHLDYRVKHHGRWIDPMSIGSVPAKALSSSEMPAFKRWQQQLVVSMETGSPLALPETDRPWDTLRLAGQDNPLGSRGSAAAGRR